MDDTLLSRAFDVEEIPDNFDPAVPPSTGHEYLQHVMYEASKCPQVVVADISKRKIKNYVNLNMDLGEEISCKVLAPSAEWQHHQVAIFADLRKKVELARSSEKFKPLLLKVNELTEKDLKEIGVTAEDLHLRDTLRQKVKEASFQEKLKLKTGGKWTEERKREHRERMRRKEKEKNKKNKG